MSSKTWNHQKKYRLLPYFIYCCCPCKVTIANQNSATQPFKKHSANSLKKGQKRDEKETKKRDTKRAEKETQKGSKKDTKGLKRTKKGLKRTKKD